VHLFQAIEAKANKNFIKDLFPTEILDMLTEMQTILLEGEAMRGKELEVKSQIE
jgi:hypothetical protein